MVADEFFRRHPSLSTVEQSLITDRKIRGASFRNHSPPFTGDGFLWCATYIAIGGSFDRTVIVIEGLTEDDLDTRGGSNGWSIRETVHHLVEANLVAAGIVIAALGKTGCTFDWSWLNPDLAWMERMGYKTAPVEPAIETLRALTKHLSGLIDAAPNATRREVKLLDAPGAELRVVSVAEILAEEVRHVTEHLRELSARQI